MAVYVIDLNKKQEKFLDLYLSTYKLRKEHTRNDYPGLIAHNFINSMMKRKKDVLVTYEKKYGKPYRRSQNGS